MPKVNGLNARQTMFVQEYPVALNAAKAALRAGYSPRSAKQIGMETLTKSTRDFAMDVAMAKGARVQRPRKSRLYRSLPLLRSPISPTSRNGVAARSKSSTARPGQRRLWLPSLRSQKALALVGETGMVILSLLAQSYVPIPVCLAISRQERGPRISPSSINSP